MTFVTKNCLEYNITVITKLHSKYELDLNKFAPSLIAHPLRNKGHVNISAPDSLGPYVHGGSDVMIS